jgi:two-component system LytT family response regulator
MTLRVLIADDEPLARQRLRRFLAADADVEIIGESSTGPETIQAIQAGAPDLVLLDIRMPELDGFEVIRAVGSERAPAVVFVTAHDHYALKAFETHAVDYLLKPVDRDRLQLALRRVRDAIGRNDGTGPVETILGMVAGMTSKPKAAERFAIRSGGRIVFVSPAEIDWIGGANNYTEFHVGPAVHLYRQTLNALERQLPSEDFIRISRSHMVNMRSIREIRSKTHGDYWIVLHDGTELPGSRNYRDRLPGLLCKRTELG